MFKCQYFKASLVTNFHIMNIMNLGLKVFDEANAFMGALMI